MLGTESLRACPTIPYAPRYAPTSLVDMELMHSPCQKSMCYKTRDISAGCQERGPQFPARAEKNLPNTGQIYPSEEFGEPRARSGLVAQHPHVRTNSASTRATVHKKFAHFDDGRKAKTPKRGKVRAGCNKGVTRLRRIENSGLALDSPSPEFAASIPNGR